MKDKLEDFIHQNRAAFDDKEPKDNVWYNVEKSLPLRRRTWNSLALWRAAAILFMGLSVYLLIPKGQSSSKNSEIVMKEFQDVETYYVQQISEKAHLIDQFQQGEGLNGFTHDFQQLEAMYMVLKEEMKVHPNKKVKDALVLNLLVRIDLLNQQLHKLDQKNEAENEGEENDQARKDKANA